jgi:Tol biopolymer transport system component
MIILDYDSIFNFQENDKSNSECLVEPDIPLRCGVGCEGEYDDYLKDKENEDECVSQYTIYEINVSKEEHIEKWYGDEIGYNDSLISSNIRLTFNCSAGSPSFSPDGKKIIYTSRENGGNLPDIWMMDIDGTNHTQLTFNDNYPCQPKFLSDGIHIMYVTSWKSGITIWVKNLQDNSTIHYDINGMHPNVTPDNRIIYISNSTQIIDVNLENILYLPANSSGHWPDMNGDGTKIASELYRCYRYNQLLLADLVNDTMEQLTFDAINHCDPTISPNGEFIVYHTYEYSYGNLWFYDIQTGNQYQLTFGRTCDAMAEISPDGKQIVYGSTKGNSGWSFDIWLMTLGPSY